MLADGGSVVVNKGRSAIRVTLGAARGELPAGTTVDVAVAPAERRRPGRRDPHADPDGHANAEAAGEEGQAPQGAEGRASA